jgi:FixJ family two-component response regulator
MQPMVFLVDDDRTFLRSTTRFFESEEFPVAAFRSGEEFFENYITGQPGCLLLDLKMPAMNGLDVLDMMRELGLTLPTIVMTAFGNIQLAVQAMKRGALDFVEKPIHNNPELLEMVRRAMALDRVSQKVHQEVRETGDRLGLLTDREREILFRVADGHSSSEIATEFGVSLATVNSQRINILKKMGVSSVRNLITLISRYRFAQQPPSLKSRTAVKKRR